MIKYLTFGFILLCFSCVTKESEENSKESTKKSIKHNHKNTSTTQNNPDFTLVSIKEIPIDYKNICNTEPLEFNDLYKNTNTILDDSTERLLIVQELKKEGFKIDSWGRGNFMEGPRIISITMIKDKCTLRIDKLYYSTDTIGTYHLTERISVVEPN